MTSPHPSPKGEGEFGIIFKIKELITYLSSIYQKFVIYPLNLIEAT